MAVGANAIWLAGFAGKLDASILLLLFVACGMSLLPDIDIAGSGAKVHYVGGGVLGVFRGVFHGVYFGHRGLMHSVLAAVIVFVVCWLFTHSLFPVLPFVAALAYFSHSLIDGFNDSVGYFYPFVLRKVSLLPKFLRVKVGGPVDVGLMYVALLCLALFFLVHAQSFLPNINSSFILGQREY